MSRSEFFYRSSINSVSFSVGSDVINRKESTVTVDRTDTFSGQTPVINGLSDPHMGPSSLSYNCLTCHNDKRLCPGHDGLINMNYPLQSPAFYHEILSWLKIICFKCGLPISSRELKAGLTGSDILRDKAKDATQKSNDMIKNCSNCNAEHPWLARDTDSGLIIQTGIKSKRKDIGIKTGVPLFNHEIKAIFARVSNTVLDNLKLPRSSHPSNFILSTIKVPSVAIRPEMKKMINGRLSISDTTTLLKSIIELNNQIPREMPKEISSDLKDKLSSIDKLYYNMTVETPTVKKGKKPSAYKSIASGFFRKIGRLRGNIMGRRTFYMIRGVIIGDSGIPIDHIGIPLDAAKTVFIPETVTAWNKDQMNIYYLNGDKKYPGVNRVIKGYNKKEFNVTEEYAKTHPLEIGDTVYRNLIDGDFLGINREPAIVYTSIVTFYAKIVTSKAIRLNPDVCSWFHADFDGDEMNVIVQKKPESLIETKIISSVNNWIVWYQNSEPQIGLIQDHVIGSAELTNSETVLDKFHAMRLFNKTQGVEFTFDKKTYTGRELFTKVLPPGINYTQKPKFYKPEFKTFIPYAESDMMVEIRNGVLTRGIVDGATVGQGEAGSLFHSIYLEKGPEVALSTMFNVQQMVNEYNLHRGISFGIKDVMISAKVKKEVQVEIDKIISRANAVTEKRDSGKLLPPIGKSLNEFYEQAIMAALVSGDDFLIPYLKEVDPKTSWLFKFVFFGSKGSTQNMQSLFSAVGSIGIHGDRIPMNYDGRCSVYFTRFDSNPAARGYNAYNFVDGLHPSIFFMSCIEARYELIEVALSTAKSGRMNRDGVKNLESLMVNNMRSLAKPGQVVQLLYGETGYDSRKLENVSFPTLKISDADFAKYKTSIADFKEPKTNTRLAQLLDYEWEKLQSDRKWIRNCLLEYARGKPSYVIPDKIKMVVNIGKIIETVVQDKNVRSSSSESKKYTKNGANASHDGPIAIMEAVNEYIDNIKYIYTNPAYKTAKRFIPEYIATASKFLAVLIRSNLNSKKILDLHLTYDDIVEILDIITLRVATSFMQYGTCAGIIAVESVNSQVTQYLLDSKHRAGLMLTKTNLVERFKELINHILTEKMFSPQMLLVPLDEYASDKNKVQEIADHIMMLPFSKFWLSTKICIEEFAKPTYPDFINEGKRIEEFVAVNNDYKPPRNLINACIRFEISRTEMLARNLKLRTIITKLIKDFPDLYFVYFPEIHETIIIRVYIQSRRAGSYTSEKIISISEMIKNTIIRGTEGIYDTHIFEKPYTTIANDGSIDNKTKRWVIETTGTNMSAILENKYLNIYQCTTTAVREIESLFGIEAARTKIADEIHSAVEGKTNYEHTIVYADEMASTGTITSIQISGMKKRDENQIYLRATFGSPMQVLSKAALYAQRDVINTLSASLVVGQTPKFGTTYNDAFVDPQAIAKYKINEQKIRDEL